MKTTIKRSDKGKSIEYWELTRRDDHGRLIEVKTSMGFWMRMDHYDIDPDIPAEEIPGYKNYTNSYGDVRHQAYSQPLQKIVVRDGFLEEDKFNAFFSKIHAV